MQAPKPAVASPRIPTGSRADDFVPANRGNALRSTGPKTEDGKRRSRQNAVRHGLTSETVIVALEDIEDYQAFEAAVIADYDARLPFRPIWRAGRGRRLVQRLGGVAL